MILVVADTSPLNYLIQIHCQELLPTLYQRVFVPTAVIRELAHIRAPAMVRAWLSNVPEWLEIREVQTPPDVTPSRTRARRARGDSTGSGRTRRPVAD